MYVYNMYICIYTYIYVCMCKYIYFDSVPSTITKDLLKENKLKTHNTT